VSIEKADNDGRNPIKIEKAHRGIPVADGSPPSRSPDYHVSEMDDPDFNGKPYEINAAKLSEDISPLEV
jgi:hypothetical protein